MSMSIASMRTQVTTAEDQDSCRLMMMSSAGTDLFLREDNGRCFFPAVEIPRFSRFVSEINECVRTNWTTAATLLLTSFAPSDCAQTFFAVLEIPKECEQLPGLLRCRLTDAEFLLDDKGDIAFLKQSCSRLLNGQDPYLSKPFAQLGWIYELQHWVEQVPGAGMILSYSQLSGSDDTCLMKFKTSLQTLFYKAVGQSDPKEFAITLALRDWLPDYLPRIIAVDSNRKAWLMESAGEPALWQQADFELWVSAARRLADMQIASLTHAPELLKKGCIDVRVGTLQTLVRPFFEFMGLLMQEQLKNPPAPLTRGELGDTAACLSSALSELAGLDIPDVIGHSDFNPGNVLLQGGRIVFIDWSAAHVGNPLLTLEYLIAHCKRNCAALPAQDVYLRQIFREKWCSIVPDDVMRQAQELCRLIAVFASAVSDDTWRDPARLACPGSAGYLRSLARIMRREALPLIARRSYA